MWSVKLKAKDFWMHGPSTRRYSSSPYQGFTKLQLHLLVSPIINLRNILLLNLDNPWKTNAWNGLVQQEHKVQGMAYRNNLNKLYLCATWGLVQELNHQLPQSWPMNSALWHRARSYHFSDSLIGSRWATKNIVGKVGVTHTHFIHDQYCSLLPSNREPVPHQSLVSTLWQSCKTKLWHKTKHLHTSKNPKKTTV